MGKLSVAVLGLCTTLSVWAQETPADFTAHVPLNVSGSGPWYRLELPLAVQLNARQADLGDVRVFNAAGEPQAYALSRQASQRSESRNVTAVKWFPLYAADTQQALPNVVMKATTSGTLVEIKPSTAPKPGKQVLRGWVLDASAIKAPLQQLSLDWSREQEGFQRFSIEASDDLQHWKAWGDGQVARLSFADERVEQHDVSLPGQSARYLRLVWQGQAAPLLTSAKLESATSSTLPMPLVWSQAFPGERLKAGEYSWQLPTGLNVERLRVELKQPNTLAPVTLSGRSDAKQTWLPLSNGLLYRLTQNGKDVVQDELQLPGQTVAQLKLQVDERGGGLGVEAPALRVAVRATQLVFLARGEPPFSLALGNASVKAASLPLSTLIPDYSPERLKALGQATLVGEIAVKPPAIAALPEAGTDWKKLGLWAVLLLGVAALGAMAYSLLRKPPVAG
ncbi:DUF3999 domain-containing protein [Pseudomonas pergaminensis]|uniref:DUF3999 domain-containing protein n=1 Tax=Pseudomonas pergaminensis TaxID=2853159 RepID=A0ABD7TRP7_9PSED|nr:DUF3999 domain-containing protein [Pseudomonas pergaminensis]USW03890.1 DUF3999 domain-containing protein [Pseudomonas pergaminensis]